MIVRLRGVQGKTYLLGFGQKKSRAGGAEYKMVLCLSTSVMIIISLKSSRELAYI